MAEFTTEEGGLSEEVIKKAFEATEDEFLRVVRESWIARPQIASVGSCCLLGAISKGVLYVANLGDSRAVRLDLNRSSDSSRFNEDDRKRSIDFGTI